MPRDFSFSSTDSSLVLAPRQFLVTNSSLADSSHCWDGSKLAACGDTGPERLTFSFETFKHLAVKHSLAVSELQKVGILGARIPQNSNPHQTSIPKESALSATLGSVTKFGSVGKFGDMAPCQENCELVVEVWWCGGGHHVEGEEAETVHCLISGMLVALDCTNLIFHSPVLPVHLSLA